MSKYKTMIRQDIKKCEELIEKGFAQNTDVQTIVGKYIIDYPDFSKGLHNYASAIGSKPNEIENIRIVKGKLEYLLNRVDNPELYTGKSEKTININASSNNNISNSNNIEIYFSLEDIKDKIQDNTYLGDKEKEELLIKLKEIEELQKSKESKTKKWNIAKKILGFILDKGADIAIMFIPQILKALQ